MNKSDYDDTWIYLQLGFLWGATVQHWYGYAVGSLLVVCGGLGWWLRSRAS